MKTIERLKDGVYYVDNEVKIESIPDIELYENGDWDNPIYYFYDINNLPPTKVQLQDYIKDNNLFENVDTIYLANPYETSGVFLLDTMPEELSYIGSGFNYGSNNLVVLDKPGRILILAAND